MKKHFLILILILSQPSWSQDNGHPPKEEEDVQDIVKTLEAEDKMDEASARRKQEAEEAQRKAEEEKNASNETPEQKSEVESSKSEPEKPQVTQTIIQKKPLTPEQALYAQALHDYAFESEDYISTMKVTRTEVRTWRGMFLAERFEGKLGGLESSLVQSNKQIILEVDKAIDSGGLDSLDDVLLMRMAQLQFEKETLSLNLRMKNYESKLRAFLAGRIHSAPELPAANYKSTIEYCRNLLLKYPRSPLSDKAHYLMAYSLDEMGEFEAAIEIYKRFIRRHPFSPLVDEVKWRVAEHYFDTRELNKAAFFYSELSRRKKSSYRLKALYKLGASYFAGGKYDSAADTFTQLYTETKKSIEVVRENETLLDESLEYLGIIQEYGVKVSLDPDTLAETVSRLAKAYTRMPNEARARRVYIDFMRREPYSPRVPFFSEEAVQSYLSEADTEGADRTRDRYVDLMTKTVRWWKVNFNNREPTFEAEDVLEEYLLSSARSHAEKGFEKKDKQELKSARDQYLRFLRDYPYSALFVRARFELAQVEYFSGLYDAAIESYDFVMNSPEATEYLDDAAYGRLWATIKKIGYPMERETNLAAKRDVGGQWLPPQKLSEQDKNFLIAAELYVEKVKTGSHRQKVLYKIAEVYFQNNNFDLSQTTLNKILDDQENVTIMTAKALRLSAEIANVKGDWELVSQRNAQLLSLSFSADLKGMNDVQTATAGSQSLETASKLDMSGKKLEAAREYERVALGLPRAKFAPHATFRAAALYLEEGKYKESLDNAERLKGTDFEAEGVFLRANNLKSLMSFQQAADTYDLFIKNYPRHTWIGEALFSAASLRRDLKQYKLAAELFVRYNEVKKIDTALFEAAELYSKIGDTKSVIALAGKIGSLDKNHLVRAKSLLAEYYWTKGNIKQVVEQCRQIGAATKSQAQLSALEMRSRSTCLYYNYSYLIKKSGKADGLESQATLLEKSKQKDLAARLYADAGEFLIKSGAKAEGLDKLKKAWILLGANPYTEEGLRVYSLLLAQDDKYPINIGVLANWKLAEGHYFDWVSLTTQQLAWGNARSLCEREFFDECLAEINKIAKNELSEEILQNKIIAQLRAGHNGDAAVTINVLGEKTEWAQAAQRMAILTGQTLLVPLDKLKIDIPEQNQRAEALVTQAVLELQAQKYKPALGHLQEAILEASDNVTAYVVLARLFHETGHFELMRTVLHDGAKNTKSRSGLLGLSLFWTSVLGGSDQRVSKGENDDQMDVAAFYGWGLGSLVQSRIDNFNAIDSVLSEKGVWKLDYQATSMLISQQKLPAAQTPSDNAHLTLVESLGQMGSTRLDLLKQSINQGQISTRFMRDYERMVKQ